MPKRENPPVVLGMAEMKIKKEKLEKIFEYSREVFQYESEKRGQQLMPYCFIKNDETGELIIYSSFGMTSKRIMELLKEKFL